MQTAPYRRRRGRTLPVFEPRTIGAGHHPVNEPVVPITVRGRSRWGRQSEPRKRGHRQRRRHHGLDPHRGPAGFDTAERHCRLQPGGALRRAPFHRGPDTVEDIIGDRAAFGWR